MKIFSSSIFQLLFYVSTTYCYNVIRNNTKFLFNTINFEEKKDAFTEVEYNRWDKREMKVSELEDKNDSIAHVKPFFEDEKINHYVYDKNRSSLCDNIPEQKKISCDIYKDSFCVHTVCMGKGNLERYNSWDEINYSNEEKDLDNYRKGRSNNEDGGGGDDDEEEEEERKRMFDLAMELKRGSKNRKKNIQKSITIFEKLVQGKKDMITSASYYQLGKILFFGYKSYFFSYKRNLNLGLYYIEKSAEMKNAAALHFLSFVYFYEFDRGRDNGRDSGRDNGRKNGRGEEYHVRKAIEQEVTAARMNYTPSQLTMAYKYLYGINMKVNCEKAKYYYKLIAEKVMNSEYINIPLSDLDELNNENINIHNEINNLKNNEEEIMEYLNEQIKGGDIMAMYDLGKKYKEEKNFKKAFQYINEASKKNNLFAFKELGIIYLYGYGTQKNILKSIEYFSKAADAGDVESKCYLGYIYYFIDDFRNVQLSLKYLIEAANHDYGEAFFFLAEIILDISIKKRYISDNVYRIVFKLYENSADLGYVQAYFREAQLYEIGKGIKESCLNAALSYKFVAESTMWTNKIRQGMNYYIERDYVKSFYTYALAAYEGYEVGQSNLIYIYKNNKLQSLIKPEKVMQILNMLYNQGNYRALYEMGEMYKKKNKESLSVSCYKLGLRKGDLRNLLPLADHYEKKHENRRALKYINCFIKQKKREKESTNTKMEKIKRILKSSLLYFRKYKLIFKNLYNNTKRKRKN
ncbi:ubiquitin-protein ligase, putative [Plasmodium ovale]|uniref:Ubiquitin-protein ligase, putative n=1 Tax=Plasmodium ovale TaxID=36330 RepID=A0A1D3TH23_PLAOA|nr:ubiquitin-protein ligase, putative [Plasmodium ovale]